MVQPMSVKDLDASTAANDFDMAMQLVMQLPHDARRSYNIHEIAGRLIEQKYGEVHFRKDLRVVGD